MKFSEAEFTLLPLNKLMIGQTEASLITFPNNMTSFLYLNPEVSEFTPNPSWKWKESFVGHFKDLKSSRQVSKGAGLSCDAVWLLEVFQGNFTYCIFSFSHKCVRGLRLHV